MQEDPTEAENFEPSDDSQEFISPEGAVSPPSTDILPPKFLPFPTLTKEINTLLSAKAAVTYPEEDASTDVPQSLQTYNQTKS